MIQKYYKVEPIKSMLALQRTVQSIDDPETKQILDELSRISGVAKVSFENRMLLHFLQQVMTPNGANHKPVPITKQDLDSHDALDAFALRKKVGKTGDDVYSICRDLAHMNGKHIDDYNGTSLYVFLAKMILARPTTRKTNRWLAH